MNAWWNRVYRQTAPNEGGGGGPPKTDPPKTDPPSSLGGDPPKTDPPKSSDPPKTDPPKSDNVVWPTEWHKSVTVGLDEKDAAIVKRYSDPPALAKALVAANKRIGEGFKPEPFPEKGTPEAQAAWRTAQNIPEKPDAYLAKVGDGIVIGEEDKPIFLNFAEHAHKANLPQGVFNEAVKWYTNFQAESQAALEETNKQAVTELEDTLVAELGSPAEYRANRSNIIQMLSTYFKPDAVSKITSAMAGSLGLVNDPDVFRGFMALAKVINPMPKLAGSGNDPGAAVDNRLEEISKIRKTNVDAFWKNEKLVKEERELLEAKAQMGAR